MTLSAFCIRDCKAGKAGVLGSQLGHPIRALGLALSFPHSKPRPQTPINRGRGGVNKTFQFIGLGFLQEALGDLDIVGDITVKGGAPGTPDSRLGRQVELDCFPAPFKTVTRAMVARLSSTSLNLGWSRTGKRFFSFWPLGNSRCQSHPHR